MLWIFLKWIRLVLCPSMWSLRGDAPCELGDGVYLPPLGVMFCVCLPCCFSPTSLYWTSVQLIHHLLEVSCISWCHCLPSVLPMLLPVIRNYVLRGYIFTIVLSPWIDRFIIIQCSFFPVTVFTEAYNVEIRYKYSSPCSLLVIVWWRICFHLFTLSLCLSLSLIF